MSKPKTMNDFLRSMIRTFVPVVAGLIISGLAQLGIDVDTAALSGILDGIFIGGYYALVRFLEDKSPKFGWFLGLPSPPNYQVWTAKSGLPDTLGDEESGGDNDNDAPRT